MSMIEWLGPYVVRGAVEIRQKSLTDIQRETALVWCGRACAARSLGKPGDAIEYGHEAVEHAALSGDDELLRRVREALAAYRVLP